MNQFLEEPDGTSDIEKFVKLYTELGCEVEIQKGHWFNDDGLVVIMQNENSFVGVSYAYFEKWGQFVKQEFWSNDEYDC